MGTRRLSSAHGEFTLFFTKSSPFSNFYPCMFEADALDGKIAHWNCVEHYYMYNKAIAFDSRQAAEAIFPLNDPKRMKIIGSELTDKDKCAKWNEISGAVMKKALTAKYTQNTDLRHSLFMTFGSKLVECSPTDRKWGIGITIESDLATNPLRWRGENRLGKIMDEVRDRLWEVEDFCEQRTQVEDGLGIPGFAVAYFNAKFPFIDNNGKPDYHSNAGVDRRNLGSARCCNNSENTTTSRKEESRKRNRDRRRTRSRSTPTPVFRRRRSSTPRRRSPAKKRGRRDSSTSSTSSASTFGRFSSPERYRRKERQKKSRSPVKETKGQEYEPAASAVHKSVDDMVKEFLKDHVLKNENTDGNEKKDVVTNKVSDRQTLEDKTPGKYMGSPKSKRLRIESRPSTNGKALGRSPERKKREERRRKSGSRSKSRERKYKKSTRKSRSPSRRHHSKQKKTPSRHEEKHSDKNTLRDSEKKKKEPRKEDSKATTKLYPSSVPKKEKSEEEKKRDSTVQKLMSGLLNKKKNDTIQQSGTMLQNYYYQQF